MELKELLGEELYTQVQQKIDSVNANEADKLKHIRYADLSEGGYVAKAKYEDEVSSLTRKLESANATIEKLKSSNIDNEALQKEIDGYKETVKTLEKEADGLKKTYDVKEQLTKAGAIDPEYIIYKQGGIDKFKFDKDGKAEGIDELIQGYKENKSYAHLFSTVSGGGYSPTGGKAPGVTNPFAKESYNLTEQGKMLRENPTQARAMAEAVGYEIP